MNRYFLFVRMPFFCAIVALIAMGIFAKRGWLDWRRMVQHNVELSGRIEVALGQRDDLAKQIRALDLSAFAQEQAVRHHLGYVRPEELVVEFP